MNFIQIYMLLEETIMTKYNFDIRRILSFPQIYQLLQNLVRSEKHLKSYVENHIKIKQGDMVLDIGCGPADILNYLPDVTYVGFDLSQKYIDEATKKFGNRGSFFCQEVSKTKISDESSYDIVLANNCLHHLNDKEALDLFELALFVLKPGGRLVTCDGCKVKNDNLISRLMLALDRGKFVRTQDAYTALASKVFSNVQSYIRNDLSNIPIAGIIMECVK